MENVKRKFWKYTLIDFAEFNSVCVIILTSMFILNSVRFGLSYVVIYVDYFPRCFIWLIFRTMGWRWRCFFEVHCKSNFTEIFSVSSWLKNDCPLQIKCKQLNDRKYLSMNEMCFICFFWTAWFIITFYLLKRKLAVKFT